MLINMNGDHSKINKLLFSTQNCFLKFKYANLMSLHYNSDLLMYSE